METPTLTVTRIQRESTLILSLCGDAGFNGVPILAQAFEDALAQHPTLVIIDAAHLDFAGSMAMGLLMKFRADLLQTCAGHVAVCGLQSPAMKMLCHLRLDRVVPLYETVEAALNAGAPLASARVREAIAC